MFSRALTECWNPPGVIYIAEHFVYYCEQTWTYRDVETMRGAGMILPLDRLIGWEGNVYELTCAAIRRAAQITLAEDEEIAENEGKTVSTALKQILTKKVEYRLDQQN